MDRKILIGIGAALSAALCAVLFTGCGSTEAKLGRMAETYIRKKYGFSVKSEGVSEDGTGWLDPIWKKSNSGVVRMTHEDNTFYVFADLDNGVDACTDNYLERDMAAMVESCIDGKISCSDRYTDLRYTCGAAQHYRNQVGMDIKTTDQLLANIKTLDVYISTYGLDIASLEPVDLSGIAGDSSVIITDWNEPSLVQGHTNTFAEPFPDQMSMFRCSVTMKGGEMTVHEYRMTEADGMTVAYTVGTSGGDMIIAPYGGDVPAGSSGDALTPWYTVTNDTAESMKVWTMWPENKTQMLYHIDLLEDGAVRSIQLMNNIDALSGDTEHHYYFHYYFNTLYLEPGETAVFRLTKDQTLNVESGESR